MSLIESLTDSQAWLLKKLVDYQNNGELIEPFLPLPVGTAYYVIYLRSQNGVHFQWLSDLDVLCLHDCLAFQWNRMSTAKSFRLTKVAHKFVDAEQSDFESASLRWERKLEKLPQTVLNQERALESFSEPESVEIRVILQKILPKRDYDDAIIKIQLIENYFGHEHYNRRVLVKQTNELILFIQNFMQPTTQLKKMETYADFYVAFGKWQKWVIKNLLNRRDA